MEVEEKIKMHFSETKPDRRLPVDRGWAWVTLIASSIILIILQGNVRTFGLFFVELQWKFQTTSSTISMVLGTQSIANCLSSFFALNCLSTFVPCRQLIIIGSVLSALCFILDSLINSAVMLPFSHLLNGAGIAFIYGPCFVNIGHYFKKYQGTANALASCGASVGQFLFSPLVVLLISNYGIRGALLLNSAIFLQCTIFAMFLRPISFFEKASYKDRNPSSILSNELSYANRNEVSDGGSNKQHASRETDTRENVAVNTLMVNPRSKDFENTNPEQEEKKILLAEVTIHNEIKQKNTEHKIEKHTQNGSQQKDLSSSHQHLGGDKNKQDYIICGQTKRKNCNFISSFVSMNKNEKKNSKWRQILSIVDFKLFKERKFILYFFAAAIGQNASISPQTYFPPHAEDIGLGRKEGAYFVAIAGFADLGGRILTTLIADRTFLNRPRFLGLVLFSHGIIGCFIPLYRTFWAFSIYCIYYGASGGILFALLPTILTDFVGERRLSQGLGLVYLFNGLLSSIYYPILGFLRDLTESYDVGFGMNSVALIFSGVLFLTDVCIKHRKISGSEN